MEQIIFKTKDTTELNYLVVNDNNNTYNLYLFESNSSSPDLVLEKCELEFDKETKYYFYHPNTNDSFVIVGIFSKIDIDSLDKEEYKRLLSSKTATIFEDTMAFQQKYGLLDPNIYGFLTEEKMKVKLGHLQEELDEIYTAYQNKDLAQCCDGLLDLIYVASGTLNLMNVPATELWNDIQIRNMQKIRATSDNMGKRGSTFDVIKPKGWKSPRTEDILDR